MVASESLVVPVFVLHGLLDFEGVLGISELRKEDLVVQHSAVDVEGFFGSCRGSRCCTQTKFSVSR